MLLGWIYCYCLLGCRYVAVVSVSVCIGIDDAADVGVLLVLVWLCG